MALPGFSRATAVGFADMLRNQLRHLKHVDAAFAVEYAPQPVIGVNLSFFGFILETILFYVGPQLFC